MYRHIHQKIQKTGQLFFHGKTEKRHPKTFLLQDEKDACQPPALRRSTAGSYFFTSSLRGPESWLGESTKQHRL